MNFLGDDIKCNDFGDLVINPGSGDFSTASGIDCLVQDVMDEFSFSYLDDPDHPERGNMVSKFVNADISNKITISEMKQEAKNILKRDPRIESGSIKVKVVAGEFTSIDASFTAIDGKRYDNLIIPVLQEELL